MSPLTVIGFLGLIAICAAGGRSPAQRYLPPHGAPALHYHGVSGRAQAGAHAPAPVPTHGNYRAPQSHIGQHSGGQQIPILRNDYQNDANGNYNFGFDTANGIHRDETGEFSGGWPHGSLGVRGSYSYTGDDGQQYTVNYIADKNGFRPEGAHLPTPPTDPGHTHQALQHQAARGGYSSRTPSARYLPPAAGYRQRRHYH